MLVAPKNLLGKSDKKLNDKDFIKICKTKIKDLVYKKIIIWCGIIDKCYELSLLWKEYFPEFLYSS